MNGEPKTRAKKKKSKERPRRSAEAELAKKAEEKKAEDERKAAAEAAAKQEADAAAAAAAKKNGAAPPAPAGGAASASAKSPPAVAVEARSAASFGASLATARSGAPPPPSGPSLTVLRRPDAAAASAASSAARRRSSGERVGERALETTDVAAGQGAQDLGERRERPRGAPARCRAAPAPPADGSLDPLPGAPSPAASSSPPAARSNPAPSSWAAARAGPARRRQRRSPARAARGASGNAWASGQPKGALALARGFAAIRESSEAEARAEKFLPPAQCYGQFPVYMRAPTPPTGPNPGVVLSVKTLAAALADLPWVRELKAIETANIPVIKLLADPSAVAGDAAAADDASDPEKSEAETVDAGPGEAAPGVAPLRDGGSAAGGRRRPSLASRIRGGDALLWNGAESRAAFDKDDDALGYLLTFFLEFFGRHFDPQRHAVSVLRGDAGIIAMAGPGYADANQWVAPLIEDPLECSRNVARSCFAIAQIQNVFAHCLCILESKGAAAALRDDSCNILSLVLSY
ncbi:polynucleotide adenylyltransferase [Aureococcus anophagefferens]|uniref:Polynucleotide adenylyltransferase n=1 Tax=Aureococcus anophagefferens TaxID=44056 RepID=A0ABR1FW59_AURAN